MIIGYSPQVIIDSLVANDQGGNPSSRQYGIVDYYNGHSRAASYTGINCQDYKNDTNHIYYSIQGNILLGQQVLDSMQSRFSSTAGTLADRLMAALQGAKMIGADTRCAAHNSSSLSSFLRVARLTDPYDTLYCDLYMAYPQTFSGNCPVDPIDSLQSLYNLWKTTTSIKRVNPGNALKVWSTSDGELFFDFSRIPEYRENIILIYDITGRIVAKVQVTRRLMNLHLYSGNNRSLFFYQVISKDSAVLKSGKLMIN